MELMRSGDSYLNRETYSFSTIGYGGLFYADDILDGEYQVGAVQGRR